MKLGPTLGRWHEWRQGFSAERGYARPPALVPDSLDADEEIDRLQMHLIDDEVCRLPQDMQLAIQHIARAESLGVEVVHNARLPRGAALDSLIQRSLAALEKRLLRVGMRF